MSERVKDIMGGIFSTILVLTFAIPVIPIGGALIYNHYNSDVVPIERSQSTNKADESVPDSLETEVQGYSSGNEYETYSDLYSEDEEEPTEYEQYSGFDESSDEGYVNTYGNYVPSPSYENYGNPTARCADGTYSYSQSRRGTCSYHGGVSSWY
jgi:hypothetical protein